MTESDLTAAGHLQRAVQRSEHEQHGDAQRDLRHRRREGGALPRHRLPRAPPPEGLLPPRAQGPPQGRMMSHIGRLQRFLDPLKLICKFMQPSSTSSISYFTIGDINPTTFGIPPLPFICGRHI